MFPATIEVEEGVPRRDPRITLRRQVRPHHGVTLFVADVGVGHGGWLPSRAQTRRRQGRRRGLVGLSVKRPV